MGKIVQITLAEYKNWLNDHEGKINNYTPFHHPLWLENIEHTLGVQIIFLGLVMDGNMVAVFPGNMRGVGPIKIFGSPLRGTMTTYLGPIYLSNKIDYSADEILITFIDYLKNKLKVLYIDIVLKNENFDAESFDVKVFRLGQSDSYRLDLTLGEDDLWSNLKGRARTAVRKAGNMGVEIEELADAQCYFDLLESTFSRRGVSGFHPYAYFEGMISQFPQAGLLRSWGARYDGKIIAAGLFLYDEQEMHYLSGASSFEYRSVPASNLLQWHSIRDAIQLGIREYDFGGRGISSIDRFKESFGPEIVYFPSLNWAPGIVNFAKDKFLSVYPLYNRFKTFLKKDAGTR